MDTINYEKKTKAELINIIKSLQGSLMACGEKCKQIESEFEFTKERRYVLRKANVRLDKDNKNLKILLKQKDDLIFHQDEYTKELKEEMELLKVAIERSYILVDALVEQKMNGSN